MHRSSVFIELIFRWLTSLKLGIYNFFATACLDLFGRILIIPQKTPT
jgi:hypothetical protein